MPHFAKLNSNNEVLEINVISQEDVDANGGDYSVAAENWVKSTFEEKKSQISKSKISMQKFLPWPIFLEKVQFRLINYHH